MLNLTLRCRKVIFSSKIPRIPTGKDSSVGQPRIACAVLRHQGQQSDVIADCYGDCVCYLHCWTSTLNCAEHKYYRVRAGCYLKTSTRTHTHTHLESEWLYSLTSRQTHLRINARGSWQRSNPWFTGILQLEISKCWAGNAGNMGQCALKGTGGMH